MDELGANYVSIKKVNQQKLWYWGEKNYKVLTLVSIKKANSKRILTQCEQVKYAKNIFLTRLLTYHSFLLKAIKLLPKR